MDMVELISAVVCYFAGDIKSNAALAIGFARVKRMWHRSYIVNDFPPLRIIEWLVW